MPLPRHSAVVQSPGKDAGFLADESGAMAIEYGLIAAAISVAIVAVVRCRLHNHPTDE